MTSPASGHCAKFLLRSYPRPLSVRRLYQPKTVILLEERVFS
jgi:hypothetical protein